MCLYPVLIQNKKYTATKKNGGYIPAVKDTRVLAVPIKCGHCIECMKSKAREWSIRMTEDIKAHNNAYFITLTFNNVSIKELGSEINSKGYLRDNDIAKLGVRRFLERWRKSHKTSIRHWLVTELGHQGTENIHLHGLLYTDNPEKIADIWKYGFVWIGKYVNNKTINYITKYVTKIDEKHKTYQPIILCSRGIGSNYIGTLNSKLNKYNNKDTREFYTFPNGTKASLPIYYRNKIYNDDEREQLWINQIDKQTRYVCGEKIKIDKNIETYSKCVEYYRHKNIKLGYGTNTKDYKRREYEEQLRDLNYSIRIQSDQSPCAGP